MTTSTTVRRYDVGSNGEIFTIDQTQFLDETGAVQATSDAHRTLYAPSATPPTSELNGSADARLTAIAAALWTADLIAAYNDIVRLANFDDLQGQAS